jgi:oligopeptide transport system substrate-binding protein
MTDAFLNGSRKKPNARFRPAAMVSALVLWAALAAGGCGEDEAQPEADFVFASASQHHSLDPQRMSWLHDIRLARALYEPLTRHEVPGLEIRPGAAESWAVSEDGTRYTFTIREDATWSNGDPVRAEDFVFAWRRALLPDLASDYTQLLFCIEGAEPFFSFRQKQLERVAEGALNAEKAWAAAKKRFRETVGVSAAGPRTLRVRLERPLPYFLELCAFSTFMPAHKESVQAATRLEEESGMRRMDSTYFNDPKRMVTNGAYELAARSESRVRLRAQPHYGRSEAPKSETIVEKIVEDPQTQMLQYRRGLVHWLPDIPSTSSLAADLAASGRDDVHVTTGAGTYFYAFNCLPKHADGTSNPLADRKVRRALSMAIDRKTLVEEVTRLGQPVARSFVPPEALAEYEPPVEAGAAFDPESARQLLDEAGHPDGEGLEGLSILYNTEGAHEVIAQQIRSAWEKHLGVSMSLEGVDSRAFGHRLREQQFDVARAGWFGDYRDPTTFLDRFRSGDGNNDSKWKHPPFDRLMAKAAEERGADARRRLLQRAERMVLKRQPVAPIFHYVTLDVYDPQRVRGLPPNAWHVFRLEQVRVKGAGD